MSPTSILLVDDEPLMRLSMLDALNAMGYDVQAAATGHEGKDLLLKGHYDILITDLQLPGIDGLGLLQLCKEPARRTEAIMITAHGSVETAVNAMKAGAYDYITKPFQMDELLLVVERLSKVQALKRENQQLRQQLEGKFNFQGIVGRNELMRAVLEKVKLVAGTDSTVLVVGESGTGKELVANAIHHHSPRKDQAFIKVSCAALPETLRKGRFELAHRGTLFLDEIGEISLVVQVKLLRVLQERQFERVGGNETIEVDVRLICATQKDLKKEVTQGRFREDLYYRLNVVPIMLPPLRERREDVLMLAEHVLGNRSEHVKKPIKGLSPAAEELLLRYSFPGNVRELENMIERAVALGREREEIQPWDLCGYGTCPFLGGVPQDTCGFCSEGLTGRTERKDTNESLATARERFEREYILSVLAQTEGSKTIAAKLLGLSRKGLWEKCKRYGIAIGATEPEED
jgi:DNA-binding NtrC family response regulator